MNILNLCSALKFRTYICVYTKSLHLTQFGSNLEETGDNGNYHWVGDNKKYQTIHLTLLGFTDIIQVDKHEK